MVTVPTGLYDLKIKVDDLDIGKFQTAPIDYKRLSDVMSKEIAKYTKYNTLNTKVNNLIKKITDVTTLIYINQQNT